MVEAAKHNIILSGSLCGDHAFEELLYACERRLIAEPELKVLVMALPKFITTQGHPMGHQGKRLMNRLKREYPDRFSFVATKPYWNVRPWLKVSMNHTKCISIDNGKYYMMGGSGVRDHFIKTRHR